MLDLIHSPWLGCPGVTDVTEEAVVNQRGEVRTVRRPHPVGCAVPPADREERAFDGAAGVRPDRGPGLDFRLTSGAGAHSGPGRTPVRTGPRPVPGVPPRRLPARELTVPAHDLGRRAGLIVGGLPDVPVRW